MKLFCAVTLVTCLVSSVISLECQCGTTPIKPNITEPVFKIVGGSVARPYSWPWQVLINIPIANEVCGGTLVDPHWVLTAAHCITIPFDQLNITNLTLHFGVFNRLHLGEPGVINMTVLLKDAPIKSNNYSTSFDDIGLLKLPRSIKCSDRIQPICLRKIDNFLTPGTSVGLTGWGRYEAGDAAIHNNSLVLRQVNLTIANNTSCEMDDNIPGYNSTTMFCISNADGKDSCSGDSGGPMIYKHNGSQRWYQYGIITGGYNSSCALPWVPSAITRTAPYCEWMKLATSGRNICHSF